MDWIPDSQNEDAEVVWGMLEIFFQNFIGK